MCRIGAAPDAVLIHRCPTVLLLQFNMQELATKGLLETAG
jgi:hypothetical protein